MSRVLSCQERTFSSHLPSLSGTGLQRFKGTLISPPPHLLFCLYFLSFFLISFLRHGPRLRGSGCSESSHEERVGGGRRIWRKFLLLEGNLEEELRKSRGRTTSGLGFRERRELRRVRVYKHKQAVSLVLSLDGPASG